MKPRNTQKNSETGGLRTSVPFRVFRGLFVSLVLVCALIAVVSGCHTAPAKLPARPAADTNAPVRVAWAEVAFVNEPMGYVVLRSKGLLSAAGEATVWRGTNAVARLKMGGPSRLSWLTADIISGHPQPRDRVELKITKTQNVGSGGRP